MWIQHFDDGHEMEITLSTMDGRLVETLRPMECQDRQKVEVRGLSRRTRPLWKNLRDSRRTTSRFP
jgi:hypothetical protein